MLEKKEEETLAPITHKPVGLKLGKFWQPGQIKRLAHDTSSVSLKLGRRIKKSRPNRTLNTSILRPSIINQTSLERPMEFSSINLDNEQTEEEDLDVSNDSEENDDIHHSFQPSDMDLSLEKEIECMPKLSQPWFEQMYKGSTDTKFGPHYEHSNLMLGNKKIEITDSGGILIDSELYPATEGLYDLLFQKNVNLQDISEKDKETYFKILQQTNSYKKKYDSREGVAADRSNKYRFVIKPILQSMQNKKGGGGLKFLLTNKKRQYKFWDDPNELCERLKILVEEKSA